MDVTAIFKNHAKMIKIRRNLIADESGGTSSSHTLPVMRRRARRDEFTSKAKDVVYHICKLDEYLRENERGYVTLSASFGTTLVMTPEERNKVDYVTTSITKNCVALIEELSTYAKANSPSEQLYEHRMSVLKLMQSYLKKVCVVYDNMRNLFEKRQSQYSNLIKVSVDKHAMKNNLTFLEDDYKDNSKNYSFVEELTQEEEQMFAMENEHLVEKLSAVMGEVKSIEAKVTNIAELHGTLSELVAQQELDVERIDSKIVGTTENIVEANAQLRTAVQNNASLRAYLLFFILMMSFTLLFLNWYND